MLSSSFQCPNSFKCLAQEFVCNGYADCPGGEDENNCKATCDAPRYLTATQTPTELKSRNFPYPYLGKSKFPKQFLNIISGRGECAYTIRSENGNGVRIDIVTLQIDSHDPIEIYEGSSCDQKLLKRIEGNGWSFRNISWLFCDWFNRILGGIYEDISIQSTFDVVTVYTKNSDYMNTRIYSLLYYELWAISNKRLTC